MSKSGSSKSVNISKEPEITNKIKILCLHGYRQCADSFKSKIGSFRKFTNKYAEFVFISAPHVASPMNGDQEKDERNESTDERSWWFNKDDGTFKGTNKDGPAVGFEESLRLVESTWLSDGPFEGLIGFSQGACFAGLLCGLAQKKLTPIQPKFVVLSSGFRSGSLAHKTFYEEPVSISSLHIFGETDEIIPMQMSETLASNFVDPLILKHNGGHYFPATSKQKQIYVEFFQDRLQDYLENMELEKNNSIVINQDILNSGDSDS